MKKKVYVVYNEALHHDSSYHSIQGVFGDRLSASDYIGCAAYDFQRGIDRGEFPEFDDYVERLDDPLWDVIVETKDGMYEAWRIEEHELQGRDYTRAKGEVGAFLHEYDEMYDEIGEDVYAKTEFMESAISLLTKLHKEVL